MMTRSDARFSVSGWPKILLRFEGAALLAAASFAYWRLGASCGPVLRLALIHLAHIGFDRALGYGLKYGTAFGDTHLCRIGGGASYAPR